ncbi:short-chain dehydrogenase [Burkholderia lata]|uniref:Short-chain dehydrogenase n=1 Tax=Burkholderia lata (strain ATCC 17760 / DSM 23089 / LMG 22485 / NCIMB 9086 / R18194 / 383) TaxID=482957 RepID=A0A6P2HNM5_BURL3|nr:oxidoreductase [Burkholderia lata]VWB14995.1 short-chain dehydrogenase [Burkholderia lata]VWB19527.1 short-chain dehydrogenase [Burkholderia lata]
MNKIWFITGASSGFGKALAELVLAAGDCAVLTARRLASLQDIAAPHGERALALQLDVTDAAARAAALKAANEKFGRIDVLANIAGAGSYGALEEFTSAQIRAQMELNFFAAAELSREVLPQMRARQSGHILNLTSIAGLVAFPGSGLYNASKFALEGFTEALHHEVKPLGIRVTLVEPGAFRTGFAGSAAMKAEQRIAAYAPLDAGMDEYYTTQNGQQMGDPVKGMQVVVDMVAGDTAPVRLMLGEDAYQLWDGAVASRNRDLGVWRTRGEDTAIPGAVKNTAQAL